MEMHPLCGADGLEDRGDVEAGSSQPPAGGARASWVSQSRLRQLQPPSVADSSRHRQRGVSRTGSNLPGSPGEAQNPGSASRAAEPVPGRQSRFRTHDRKELDENFGGVDSQFSHTFLSGTHDIGVMQSKLFKLMRDFNAGNLRAFGRNVSIDQMECIREQQEELARQHFEFGSQRHLFPPLSEEALQQSSAGFQKLMGRLQLLSSSIEKLHTSDQAEHENG